MVTVADRRLDAAALNQRLICVDSGRMAMVKRSFPLVLVGMVAVCLASTISAAGDWTVDSWPAVNVLAHGRVGEYLTARPMMGPFATLVQAPFAALAGGGPLEEYRWASLPCLFAAGCLGLYLARIAGRRGAGPTARLVVAALCLLNPLTLEALRYGHPEEILTAALAVAAVASAADEKPARTAVLLGLAVASKQWAVLAIPPALMALPTRRLRVAFGALAVVGLLTLPSLAVAPGSFGAVQENAAVTGRVVTPWSVWYPLARVGTERLQVGDGQLLAHEHEAPSLVGSLSHPLIVLLVLAVPLAVSVRRRRLPLQAREAMGLLALLALLRCALDPVDNLYYHEPLLLALLAWDTFASDGLPLRGLAGLGTALVFSQWAHAIADFSAFNAAYISLVSISALAIAVALFPTSRRHRIQERAGPARHLSYESR